MGRGRLAGIPKRKHISQCALCIHGGEDCIFPSKDGKDQEALCILKGVAVKIPRNCTDFMRAPPKAPFIPAAAA